MTFYEKLTELCHEHGIEVTSIGDHVFVDGKKLSSSTVGNWRNGVKPRPKTVKAIADFFKVPVAYLRNDEEQHEKSKHQSECASCPCREKCTCDLSSQEHELIKMFRESSEIGRIRMIKEIVLIWENDDE